jgi:hypothetical protein
LGRSGPPSIDPIYEGGRSILSQNPTLNPEFHNWNLVYVQYCDGGSYAGNVTDAVYAPGSSTPLYFRGLANFLAVVDHLLTQKNLGHASRVLLSGCSAGGLAVYHHCNRFAKLMSAPPYGVTHVKCMADGGFFINYPSRGVNPYLLGTDAQRVIERKFSKIFRMQNMVTGINQECLASMPGLAHSHQEWVCMWPTSSVRLMRVPFYVLNTVYDDWQIPNILFINEADGDGQPPSYWSSCAWSFNCPGTCANGPWCRSSLKEIRVFRRTTLDFMAPVFDSGYPLVSGFISSCWSHCQTSSHWGQQGPKIKGKYTMEAFHDWYFDRVPTSDSKSMVMCLDSDFPCGDEVNYC